MTSEQALREYADHRKAEAFGVLVEQYHRLVYSAAGRRLAHSHDIEDVVQLTFLKLAKSAGAIRRDLSAWLYTTAINTANDLIRRDQTRRRHEALAAPPEVFVHDQERQAWQELSLLIDEVILELPEAEQTLIVEHFLRGRSQRDLAVQLNVSQPTVLRRLNAAVEELRRRLGDHGYSITAPLLAAGITSFPQPFVPPAVTAELAKVGLSGVSSAPAGGTVFAHAFFLKLTIATLALAAILIGAITLLRQNSPPNAAGAAPTTEPAAAPPADPADWRAALNNAYALLPNQNLKYIPPPPLPERQRYLFEVEHNDSPMPYIQWRWINGKLKREVMRGGGPHDAPLSVVLEDCAKLDTSHAAIAGLSDLNFDGDWIIRNGATTEAILADLRTILLDQFKTDIRFEKTEVIKDALIVSGNYHLNRIPGTTAGDLQFYSDVPDHPKPGERIAGGGRTDPAKMWTMLADYFNFPVVDESQQEPANINWELSDSMARATTEDGRQQILDNLTKQTGLTFKKGKRNFPTWVITAANPGASATQP